MSDAGNAAPPWFNDYEPEQKAFITARGLDRMDAAAALAAAIKGHQNAEKMLGGPADQVLRMPKDASDPLYQQAYDRIVGMGAPKTPEEYKIDGVQFRDGRPLDEANVTSIRDFAAKNKLTLPVARELAGWVAERVDNVQATDTNAQGLARAANQVALRTHWGGAYDENTFKATRVAENLGLTPSVLAHMASLAPPEYIANMEALAKLSGALNEAEILRGGSPVRDPTAGLTADQAEQELERLQSDPTWGQKVSAGDAEANRVFNNLISKIAERNVQWRTGAMR